MVNVNKVVSYLKTKRRWKVFVLVNALLVCGYAFILPDKLFTDPYSNVLFASKGELLCASIASDGQWRFPQADSLPEKFVTALTTFEDKRFYSHPGVDLLSLGRAFKQNITEGKIVSGASTITMQVIRLSRKNKPRSAFEKIKEIVLASRLEIKYSKDEILLMYAAHAPFGGNVVGLDAACWRYFGSDARDLSWAQAALLAVLPNAPSLIHPGKQRDLLKSKRDKLLEKLFQSGYFDQLTLELSKAEPIPDQPHPLPRHARHLQLRLIKNGRAEERVTSTIEYYLQKRVEGIIEEHHKRLSSNQIFNAAALVLDVNSGEVLSYVGNIFRPGFHESEVDVIAARRSTGSILKPFLWAASLDEGKLLPSMLLPDAPVIMNGFAPKNFSHQYDGAVHANNALIRSLNVPAVHLLKEYRYEKFHKLLGQLGMTTLDQAPDHYGLSLILGGAEGTLWDIAGMYASLARTVNSFSEYAGKNRYSLNDFHSPVYSRTDDHDVHDLQESSYINAAAIYQTFETLKDLYRPGEESGWRQFSSSKKIAWKTGTSFGFRDGWAVGVTPDHVVAVWVGNADGEGRPGLTGVDAAAPVMFDIFSALPGDRWFVAPLAEMKQMTICKISGYRAAQICPETESIFAPATAINAPLCSSHRLIHLSTDARYQVHDGCESLATMQRVPWFVLPPVQEYFYKKIHLSYKTLPPFKKECEMQDNVSMMEMVYPKNHSQLFIPRELDGTPGQSVFELAHREPAATVFWHLNGRYIGSTMRTHHIAVNPGEGEHVLLVIDEEGRTIERKFQVISEM